MSRRARNLLGIALATLAPIVPAARSQDSGPPSNVESADSVRAWVENHKGFGLPQFAEQIKSIVVPVVTTAKRQADFAVRHSPHILRLRP